MEKIQILIEKYTQDWDFERFRDGKVLITFSAIPGAGKSTISKQLQDKFNIARINKDDLHDIMVTMGEAHNEELLKAAVARLSKMLADKGKVILFDSSIDRKYDELSEWTSKNGYELFVVEIEVSREVLERRIIERNKEGADDYLKEMDRWENEHRNFVESHKCDFVYNGEDDLNGLMQSIKEVLS